MNARITAFFAALGLLVLGYYLFAIRPHLGAIHAFEAEVASAQARAAAQEVDALRGDELADQADRIEGWIKEAEGCFRSEYSAAEYIGHLAAMARACNLESLRTEPQPLVREVPFETQTILMELRGGFIDLFHFITKLESDATFSRVLRLEVDAEGGGGIVHARLTVLCARRMES